MSTSHGTGITWAEFYAFLTGPAGCVEVGWKPGTHVHLRQPNGREFETCKPEKTGDVSLKHFAYVASEFGKNAHEMYIWMGKKPPGKSKLTTKRAARPVKSERRLEAVPPIDEMAQDIQTTAELIYRSGPARQAPPGARRELLAITRRLVQWGVQYGHGGAA